MTTPMTPLQRRWLTSLATGEEFDTRLPRKTETACQIRGWIVQEPRMVPGCPLPLYFPTLTEEGRKALGIA